MGFSDYSYYNDFGDFGEYYDGYDYSGDHYVDSFANRLGEAVMTLLLAAIVIGLVVLAAKLALYILKGAALYTIAKRMGKMHPWLGFVPFARYYLQGELSGDVQLKRGKIRDAGIWLIVLPIARSLIFGVLGVSLWVVAAAVIGAVTYAVSYAGAGNVGAVTLVLFFLALYVVLTILYQAAYRGLRMLVDYQIYERFTSRNMAILHGGFGAILPAYEAICLFVMRNKPFNEGMEPEIPAEANEEPETMYSMSGAEPESAETGADAEPETVSETVEAEACAASEAVPEDAETEACETSEAPETETNTVPEEKNI